MTDDETAREWSDEERDAARERMATQRRMEQIKQAEAQIPAQRQFAGQLSNGAVGGLYDARLGAPTPFGAPSGGYASLNWAHDGVQRAFSSPLSASEAEAVSKFISELVANRAQASN